MEVLKLPTGQIKLSGLKVALRNFLPDLEITSLSGKVGLCLHHIIIKYAQWY